MSTTTPAAAKKREAARAPSPEVEAPEIEIADRLTYGDAMAKALMENPGLQGFSREVRAREASRLQASLPPNPELDVEVENFAGSGPFGGFDRGEVTAKLGQKILLGGDRFERERVAALETRLAQWDYRTERLDVLAGVNEAYVSALEARDVLELRKELLDTAAELQESVSSQFEAGEIAELQVIKARVAVSEAEIALESAREQYDSARATLASFWGHRDPHFTSVAGELELRGGVPALDRLDRRVSSNPDVARWGDEILERRTEVAFEQAEGVPDVVLSGGVKRFEGENAGAAIVSISAPLQLYDRNQGAIRAARERVKRAEARKRDAVAETHAALERAYNRLQAHANEVRELEQSILPDSRKAFEAARTGYRQGEFNYLEVLDAQRTLFSSKVRRTRALGDYNRAAAEVERLVGTSLSEID